MSKAIDTKKVRFYLWVTLAWLSLQLIVGLASYTGRFMAWTINEIWWTAYILVLNFILFEYTVPFILQKRKYVLYNILLAIAALWVHIMFYSFGLYAWRMIGIGMGVYTRLTAFTSITHGISYGFGYSVGSVLFFGIIKHTYNHIKLKQATQQLLIEKQKAELSYLKSQTNPHFLFNTLNNIYALARDKSDLAAESILRLSKILRFMLYETDGQYIAVEQELKIISDYITLEKLRYDDSLRVNFNHDIDNMKQSLPPLLLIPLVENAFKHGVSETRNHPFVDIHLSVSNRQLVFLVKNSTEKFSGEQGVKENIGLSNLRRQLELLYKDFNLSIQQGQSAFTTTLKINLASHV